MNLSSNKLSGAIVATILVVCMSSAPSALACATCFGQSDSPLAAGVNWGIMTMIIVAYTVLFSIAVFFVFIARKAAAAAALEAENAETPENAAEESHHNELCSKNS